MCGNGENVYGIIAGLIAAAAMLVFAFAEKHGGLQGHASANAPHAAVAVTTAGLELRFENAQLEIDLHF